MEVIKKNWVILLIIAVVITVVLQLNRIGSFFGGWFDYSVDPLDDFSSNLDETLAKSYAEGFYNALRYPLDDEDIIYDLFSKLDSIADYNRVYNVFGKRRKWGFKRDLTYWLNADLNSAEKEKINNEYLNIF